MNKSYNLAILCSKCHDKVDRQEISINGWQDSTNGKNLNYYNQKKKIKKKYNKDNINIVNSYINKKISLIQAQQLLEKNNNIKISTNIISKIWNNKY